MGHEEVTQGLRGAQDREQTVPVLTRLYSRITQDAAQECRRRRRAPGLDTAFRYQVARLGCGGGLGESDEAEQSHVRIRGERQGVDEVLASRPEPHVGGSAAWTPGAIR